MNETPSQTNRRPASWLRHAPQITSVAVCALAGIALLGWTVNVEWLKSVGQPVPMNPMTALSLLIAGISLCVSRDDAAGSRGPTFTRPLARALGLAVAIVGLLRLLGYWPGWNIGVDTLLFTTRLSGNR